ncbi:MAG TPA: hypothetical protein VF683_01450 [Chthoniobacterales bacterium]|jgi:hypothetical protein
MAADDRLTKVEAGIDSIRGQRVTPALEKKREIGSHVKERAPRYRAQKKV